MSTASSTQDIATLDDELIERLTTADDIIRRPATTWANYPGDVTAAVAELIDNETPMGPNTIGEWLWPVSASFDPALKRTRVGFSYLMPATHRAAS